MYRSLVLTIALLSAVASGCATLADARYGRGEGLSRVFEAPFDAVWKAAPQALSTLGLAVAADNKADGYILAERSVTAFSWGEKVAVFVSRVSESQTKVEVVSTRALATNITAADWRSDVLQRVGQILLQTK